MIETEEESRVRRNADVGMETSASLVSNFRSRSKGQSLANLLQTVSCVIMLSNQVVPTLLTVFFMQQAVRTQNRGGEDKNQVDLPGIFV